MGDCEILFASFQIRGLLSGSKVVKLTWKWDRCLSSVCHFTPVTLICDEQVVFHIASNPTFYDRIEHW